MRQFDLETGRFWMRRQAALRRAQITHLGHRAALVVRRRRPSTTTADGERWADAFERLLFPEGVGAGQQVTIAELVDVGGATTETMRTILGSLDRRHAPSPFEVRPSAGDLHVVDVDGLRLALDRTDQSVSATIIASGIWEPHVAATIRRHLAPGSTFVDIGANVGYHTFVGACVVGPTGNVFAFEPNPANARLIAHSIELNGLSQVHLHPIALSDTIGYQWFRGAIGSNGGFRESAAQPHLGISDIVVPTTTLDRLDIGRIDLIKMDVEGAEPIVLAGAINTIRRDRPTIIFEFSSTMTEQIGGTDAVEHLASIEALGYELSIIDPGTARLVPIGSVAELMASWTDPYRIVDMAAVHPERTT